MSCRVDSPRFSSGRIRIDQGRLAMALVGLVALAVRLPHLFTNALWQDEVASARILREPNFSAMLGRVARTESTPPLWYALGWTAHQAGASIVDVRLLSALFGALLAAAVVSCARTLLPLRFATAAGLLVAVGAQFVWHGHELRAYELLALVTALFARNLARSPASRTRSNDAALAALVAIGLLTHYFFAFTVIAAALWLWLEPELRATRVRTTIFIASGAAICSPWLPYFLEQYRQDRFWWIGSFRLSTVTATPFRLFTPLLTAGAAARIVPVLFLGLVAIGAMRLSGLSLAGRLFAVLALGPLVIAGSAWASGERIFALRNLIETGPFMAIAAVAALSLLGTRTATVALIAGTAAATYAFSVTERVPTPPYNQLAADLVREGWNAHDPVAILGNVFNYRAPLEWYLPHQPKLEISRPTGRTCRTLFAIGHGRAAHGLDDVTTDLRTRGYLVARLAPDDRINVGALRGATILIDPKNRSSCVRPVRSGRLAAIA